MAATVAAWITYAAAGGDAVSDDADSAAALVRAQRHIAHHYLNRLLPGVDATTLAVVDDATYEIAKLELATPGFFNKVYTPAEQKVLTEVKGIRWTPVAGGKGGFQDATPVSTLVDAMFDPYVTDRRGPFFGFMTVGKTPA
jgi:hypothetical protein